MNMFKKLSFVLLASFAAMSVMMGMGPLHRAADRGDVAEVQRLLAAGADVNEKVDGMTALHRAAENGSVAVIHALLNAGAIVDSRERMTLMTPLHYAGMRGHVNAARELVAAGADIRAQTYGYTGRGHSIVRYTPLGSALDGKHVKMVCALLRRDDEVEAVEGLFRLRGAWFL